MNEKTFSVTLSEPQLNVVVNSLGQQKMADVLETYSAIMQQVREQTQPTYATPPEPVDE